MQRNLQFHPLPETTPRTIVPLLEPEARVPLR